MTKSPTKQAAKPSKKQALKVLPKGKGVKGGGGSQTVGTRRGNGASFKLQRRKNHSRGLPYFYADFTVWDAESQTWRRVQKSTKYVDEAKATKVAEGYWKAAQAAAGLGSLACTVSAVPLCSSSV